MSDELSFKWGTLKGWSGIKEGIQMDLLRSYMVDANPSCMLDRPSEERKEILCKLIDVFHGQFFNDWDGIEMTKEEAKKYVLNYGKP